jgi:putative selenate reductase
MSVLFCGNPAGNPLGPAAGPHTQLAQNIVLSWLSGSRIIELKTVQVKDRLTLTRPCIDMATIGYNTEWSQELRLSESLREYVKAAMIVQLLSRWLFDGDPESHVSKRNFATIFDVSVGYDVAGIQSTKIRHWLRTIRFASEIIEELRRQIPDEFARFRDLPFKSEIGNSITLSTFHGTPADEIERICEFLVAEMDYHVVIKMNPPMLGKEKLEHLLHDKLGYTEVQVNQDVYKVNMTFGDAVEVVRRLQGVAARCGKTIGVKFGNTLEVVNKGKFLKDKVQYLSGQPLHILHLTLVDEWRKVFGAHFPISFSAGVDANNFADCVSIGLVPVTVCTDLLRPGGYARIPQYLMNLERRMIALGTKTIDEFIAASAARRPDSQTPESLTEGRRDPVLVNTSELLNRSVENPRFHFRSNQKPPRKIGSHLHLWDCINCDKCIPVCPNDANFYFEVEPVEIQFNNVKIERTGWEKVGGGTFKVGKSHQIATFADACNDCGNCDVFCPEDGGPYLEKPRFFGSYHVWRKWKEVNGFVLLHEDGGSILHGRFGDKECMLRLSEGSGIATFSMVNVVVTMDWHLHRVLNIDHGDGSEGSVIDMRYYFIMATLMKGMLNPSRVHYVNVGYLDKGRFYA